MNQFRSTILGMGRAKLLRICFGEGQCVGDREITAGKVPETPGIVLGQTQRKSFMRFLVCSLFFLIKTVRSYSHSPTFLAITCCEASGLAGAHGFRAREQRNPLHGRKTPKTGEKVEKIGFRHFGPMFCNLKDDSNLLVCRGPASSQLRAPCRGSQALRYAFLSSERWHTSSIWRLPI